LEQLHPSHVWRLLLGADGARATTLADLPSRRSPRLEGMLLEVSDTLGSMRLAHLSLAVTDQNRSRRFYETFFGFECGGEPDSEGCLHLTDADGFDLTLVARTYVSPSPSLHFGIRVGDAHAVRRLLARMADEAVDTGELFQSGSRVALHCWDPDRYLLEVFWADR
jgi:catechol 2,3-dioxygenase-like lactoylglutathione lyase family enzyme